VTLLSGGPDTRHISSRHRRGDMSTLPVRLLLALAVVLAGAAVPAGAQSETPTTPVGDDDFAGNFGLNLLLLLGG
jgi:hypothetical protein